MDGGSEAALWAVIIPVVGIIGGFVMGGLGIYAGIRRREFEHRERLAMIEKGISPPDRGMSDVARLERLDSVLSYESPIEERSRRGGLVLIGVGLGITFLIWMASDEPHVAVGVGGFLVILGVAIFLSSYLGGGRRGGNPQQSQGSGGRRS